MPKILRVPAKRLRAQVIAEWLMRAGLPPRVVCFTCGNASRALADIGLDVLQIGGPDAQLQPGKWWSQAEVKRWWPSMLDATSGHLGPELINLLAERFREQVGPVDASQVYTVPTGSGETLVALALAFPSTSFVAQYDDRDPCTTYNASAPLTGLVARLAVRVDRGAP